MLADGLTLTDIGMNGDGFDRVACQDVPRSDTFREAGSFPVAARRRRPCLHGSMPSLCVPNFGWLEGRLPTLFLRREHDCEITNPMPRTTDASQTGPGKPTVFVFDPWPP